MHVFALKHYVLQRRGAPTCTWGLTANSLMSSFGLRFAASGGQTCATYAPSQR